MIEIDNRHRTPTVTGRHAFRLGAKLPCSRPGCDRTATHSCQTTTQKGAKSRAYCYTHTVVWVRRFKAYMHEMGCRWKYCGLTPRAKKRLVPRAK